MPDAPVVEAVPEVKEPEIPETPEQITAREEAEKAAEDEAKELLSPESQKAVNARIAELVAKAKKTEAEKEELAERLEALEEKSKTPGQKTWTEAELKAILADPAQADFHVDATDKLMDLKVARMKAELETRTAGVNVIQQSVNKAKAEFPDLFTPTGETKPEYLDRLKELYKENGGDENPKANYSAYRDFVLEMKAKTPVKPVRVDLKKQMQEGLSGSTRKPSPVNRDTQVLKLLDAARGTPNESPEWAAYRKFTSENPDPKETAREERIRKNLKL